MLNLKNGAYGVSIFLIVLLSCSTVCGEEAQNLPIGGGMGSILSGETITGKELVINRDAKPEFSASIASIPITGATQLVGLYVLHDFTVYFDSGAVMEGKNFVFSGDFAITQNNTAWQRIVLSGGSPVVISASFTINGNQLIAYNDLIQATSILDLSWDGTFLTTQTYIAGVPDPFTEIDVWKRVLSQPSDQDNDGVFDEWDDCPSTPLNSCVDNKGCPSSSAAKVVVIPLL